MLLIICGRPKNTQTRIGVSSEKEPALRHQPWSLVGGTTYGSR